MPVRWCLALRKSAAAWPVHIVGEALLAQQGGCDRTPACPWGIIVTAADPAGL